MKDYFEWLGTQQQAEPVSLAVQNMVGLHVLLLFVSLLLPLDFRYTVSWALVAWSRALSFMYNMSLGK